MKKQGVVLAFVSIKGGVGKTTLALETASILANRFNKKVLLVDGNFSAPNIGLYLDLTSKENYDLTLHDALLGVGLHNAIYESHGFDVVPASLDYSEVSGGEADVFKLAKILSKFKFRYDFIILDSSPNYEELKPIVAASDKIFIVTSPDEMTLTTSLKSAKLAKKNNTPIEGLIINKIRNPRYEMTLDDVEQNAEKGTQGRIPVLARIKEHKKMAEALHYRKPMTIHDSGHSISQEIQRFVSALVGEPESSNSFFQKFLPFRFFNGLVSKEKVNRELLRKKLYTPQL